ncbi:hypothetical protein DICVIV_12212 [Dictyocaulus viviparus]|uniref:Pacifastin domain-containing protein n=1 Tax=Dictyocaulus viviparus TaxID=29172 RepID=A0A0D8XHK6_DICVI|nr:hypothetical protein DICVIV_12212 [Dictyocaulus viviparus]
MRLIIMFFIIFLFLHNCAVIVNSFNVPPTGLCYVGLNGDCMRCDCTKPLKCYRGTCR